MSPTRIAVLTTMAMIAFASNSLLCRAALKDTGIDAASFTAIRLIAGALALWLIVKTVPARSAQSASAGNWLSAFALFAYAACFSFAYIQLTAATGALLLFGAVQASMITYGLFKGERLRSQQILGLISATSGLIVLLLPGLAAPPLPSAMLMIAAGIAWGVYSLRGKSINTATSNTGSDATAVTAGNFLRAVPFALVLSVVTMASASVDYSGIALAVASGALASGIGYTIWYSALPGLGATTAATVQLSVPLITAIGGVLLLGETLTLRLAIAAIAILGGIALVALHKAKPMAPVRPS